MRVILVEDVELEAQLVKRTLADRGFSDVVHVREAEKALEKLSDDVACILVTDLELSGMNGIELVRRVRARSKSPYVYCIVLTGKGTPARSREAFEAGADDFLAKPFQRDELIARVHVAQRIVSLERNLFARATELESALRQIDEIAASAALARAALRDAWRPPTAADELLEKVSWNTLRDVLRASLVEFVGVDLVSGDVTDSAAAVVGEVFLSEAAKQLEIGIAVVVGGASMQKFSEKILGASDFESGCELVLETANLMMGAVKSILSAHGYDVAAGLPSRPNLPDARTTYDSHPIRQRFAFRADNLELQVWVRICERRNSRVRGANLREGMVIAEDVHDPRGMLLIRGGVRLTATTAQRLANLAPSLEVVVALSP